MNHVTIRTLSRIHFGLLGWGPQSYRQFGGFGLMVEDPGIVLKLSKSSEWEAIGKHAARCLEIAKQVKLGCPTIQSSRIEILEVPQEHVGLGVGTQLSLAIARGLTELYDVNNLSTEDLAKLTGRGRRSGVGIHGFERGGLIVDAGTRNNRDVPTRIAALPFPSNWSILLLIPKDDQGLHGKEEIRAFKTLESMPTSITDRFCRLLLLQILPAVLENDFDSFTSGLAEIQADIGAIFAPIQGGTYARPDTEEWIRLLKDQGLKGVGQSSWGPTLYGLLDDDSDDRRHDVVKSLRSNVNAHKMNFTWTSAGKTGAKVVREID